MMRTQPLRALVVYASRHQATAEIADVIASEISGSAIDVTIASVDDVESLDGYDGVVLGSAVYMGRWQKSALAFVDRFAEELKVRPVWLFSSGPIGDPPVPEGDPPDPLEVQARVGAIEHHMFAGRIEKDRLSGKEHLIVRALHVPEGDYRDWDDIRDWAVRIGADLLVRAAA
jgi:menaquinone-dependent protoporphyrinogen oxidase